MEVNSFKKRIKIMGVMTGIPLKDLAGVLETSPNNFSTRLKTGKFTFKEQKSMAKKFNAKIIIQFVFPDSKIIKSDSSKNMIEKACKYAGISMSELSGRLGKSRQAFYDRCKHEKFNDEELSEIAEKIGCKYENYFELENGMKV